MKKRKHSQCTFIILHPVFTAGLLLPLLQSPTLALDKDDPIDTNRPSFCQSAFTVPAGSLQVENGALYQHFQHGLTNLSIPENEVRVGLLKGTEFQMFTPNMILFNQSRTTLAGMTGFKEVGIKQQIGPFKRFTMSVVGGVNIPTGSKLLSRTSVMPVIRFPYRVQLNKNWVFLGMQSITVSGPHGDILYEPAVMLSRSIGKKAAAFCEYGGFFVQNTHDPGISIAHFGGVYDLNKYNQLDLHFGFGMSRTSPSAFVGAGYSYRFDKLPWGNSKKPLEPKNTDPQNSDPKNTDPQKQP